MDSNTNTGQKKGEFTQLFFTFTTTYTLITYPPTHDYNKRRQPPKYHNKICENNGAKSTDLEKNLELRSSKRGELYRGEKAGNRVCKSGGNLKQKSLNCEGREERHRSFSLHESPNGNWHRLSGNRKSNCKLCTVYTYSG